MRCIFMRPIKFSSTRSIGIQIGRMHRTPVRRVGHFLMVFMNINHRPGCRGRRRYDLKNEHQDQEQKPHWP